MELRNGKFYEGNVIVPLEFGNTEQIKLIQEYDRLATAYRGKGLKVDPTIKEITQYRAHLSFKCLCGNRIEVEDDDAVNEWDSSGLHGTKQCHKCHTSYEISGSTEGGEMFIKILH